VAQFFGRFYLLSVVLQRIATSHCVIVDLSGEFMSPDGPMHIRYARNPATGGFYIFDDFAEGDFLAPSTMANIERRLGVDLGLPP
jgi:hypothetical protein